MSNTVTSLSICQCGHSAHAHFWRKVTVYDWRECLSHGCNCKHFDWEYQAQDFDELKFIGAIIAATKECRDEARETPSNNSGLSSS